MKRLAIPPKSSKRRLYLVVPVYHSEPSVEEAREDLCRNHPAVRRVRRAIDTRFIVIKSRGRDDLVLGKGLSVRFRLANELDNVREHDLIILVDGTGKIDFSAVENLVSAFEADTKREVGFLFGRRKSDHPTWGMTVERKELERFENCLIKTALQRKGWLPTTQRLQPLLAKGQFKDLQCGCWGFRGEHFLDVLKSLTASHYDLEIEVFVSSFKIWRFPRNRQRSKFIKFADVTLASMSEDTTRKACIAELDSFTASLERRQADITNVDVSRVIETAGLLLDKKQTNFKAKDSIFKLAAIAVNLGVTQREYLDTKRMWTKRHLSGTVKSAMDNYWGLASQLFQRSVRQ